MEIVENIVADINFNTHVALTEDAVPVHVDISLDIGKRPEIRGGERLESGCTGLDAPIPTELM